MHRLGIGRALVLLAAVVGAAVGLVCCFGLDFDRHHAEPRPGPGAGQASAPAGPLVSETWHVAYFEGARAGHLHTTVREVGGRDKRFLTTRALHLTIKRYKEVVPIRVETTSEEKPDGRAVAVSFTQLLDRGRRLSQVGRVEGGRLVVRTSAGGRSTREPSEVRLPWDEDAIGMYQQDRLFQLRKVKPGDRLTFISYEPAVRAPLTVRAAVKDLETVDVLVPRKDARGKVQVTRQPIRLLRVETQADKVELADHTKVQLPAQIVWLDGDLMPVRYQWEFPGVGQVTLYQTTREVAEKGGVAPGLLPDLGLNTTIAVKQDIERPYDTRSAVYRIRVKGEDPASAFARDARQEARDVQGDTFELHVTALREPIKVDRPSSAGEEYLESSYFLDSDNPRIQAVADRVTRGEADPWRKARRLEKWVHDNMKLNNALGFPTAGQVCRDLEGDCRQHAVLTAALCRAAEIPARTAVGVIYVREPGRSPVFVFHMWTEVHVAGQWLGLDATLGRGGIGATHLKVADQSWRNTETLAPLLPIARVLGKVSIDVVSAR
jgi:hypothetical protein